MSESVQVALIYLLGVIVVQIPAIIIAVNTRSRVDSTNEAVLATKKEVAETKEEMVALKTHVNSNTDKLVEATKVLATKTGFEEGVAQEAGKAQAVAVEVARAVEVAKEVPR